MDPTVIWIIGRPRDGKSTLGRKLSAFSTDLWVCQLPAWCQNAALLEAWPKYERRHIGAFLDWAVENGYRDELAAALADAIPKGPVVHVEGYAPVSLARRVAGLLAEQGRRVWFATRATRWKGFSDDAEARFF